MRAGLDQAIAAYPNVNVEDPATVEKQQAGQVNQLLTIIYVMLALAIIIAVLGIINTLVLSVVERTREFALLRAVGMVRRQVRRMVRGESVVIALFGAALGVLVGLGFGVALTSAVVAASGGWCRSRSAAWWCSSCWRWSSGSWPPCGPPAGPPGPMSSPASPSTDGTWRRSAPGSRSSQAVFMSVRLTGPVSDDGPGGIEITGTETVASADEPTAGRYRRPAMTVPARTRVRGRRGESRDAAATRPARSPSRYRRAGFAVARALVVLVVAAVGYQLVVPTVHVERGRLARLVPSKPGLAAFDKAKPQAAEQDDTKTRLAAMTAAAKRSPNQTGIYSIQWVPTQTTGVGIVAFLLAEQRHRGDRFLRAEGATAERRVVLLERADPHLHLHGGRCPGVVRSRVRAGVEGRGLGARPGASPSSVRAGGGPERRGHQQLHRQGRGRHGHGGRVRPPAQPGFGIHPVGDPAAGRGHLALGGGCLVLATIAALAPVVRRRRAERRRLAYEEMVANQVIVGRRVIVKHRR